MSTTGRFPFLPTADDHATATNRLKVTSTRLAYDKKKIVFEHLLNRCGPLDKRLCIRVIQVLSSTETSWSSILLTPKLHKYINYRVPRSVNFRKDADIILYPDKTNLAILTGNAWPGDRVQATQNTSH